MSVKVVKRITEDVKEFDNKEDFIKFYELNKNELKDFSTCILNKKFKIKGYHLGREKGELKLIPLDLYRPSAYRINQEDNQINLKIDVLNDKLESLKKDLNDTKQYMLKMFNNFNQFLYLCQQDQ